MDIVMVPIYNRPACLSITLELLGKTAEHAGFYYLFVADVGFRTQLVPIVTGWLQSHKGEIYRVDPSQARSPIKQSYALYRGYHRALELDPDVVFMVEDDIAVSNQFFNWHYKILDKGVDLSIATKQRDVAYPIPEDLEGYIIRSDYQSLGVAWPSVSLKKILQEFKPDYWVRPFEYIKRLYAQVQRDFVASQDGLIHKTIVANGWQVGFPVYPRAFHFGYYGMNRGTARATGSIASKISKIKAIAFNETALKAELARNGKPLDFFYDSIPTNLVLPETDRLVQR